MQKIIFNPDNAWEIEEGTLLFSFLNGHVVKIKSDTINLRYWVKFTKPQYGRPYSGRKQECSLNDVFLYSHFENLKESLKFLFRAKFIHYKSKLRGKILNKLAKHNIIQLKNWEQ